MVVLGLAVVVGVVMVMVGAVVVPVGGGYGGEGYMSHKNKLPQKKIPPPNFQVQNDSRAQLHKEESAPRTITENPPNSRGIFKDQMPVFSTCAASTEIVQRLVVCEVSVCCFFPLQTEQLSV